MLDFSIMKSKDYNDRLDREFQELRVFLKIECFGENSLTKEEQALYRDLMGREIDENQYPMPRLDDLILK